MRVGFVLRSAEIWPLFRRFVIKSVSFDIMSKSSRPPTSPFPKLPRAISRSSNRGAEAARAFSLHFSPLRVQMEPASKSSRRTTSPFPQNWPEPSPLLLTEDWRRFGPFFCIFFRCGCKRHQASHSSALSLLITR